MCDRDNIDAKIWSNFTNKVLFVVVVVVFDYFVTSTITHNDRMNHTNIHKWNNVYTILRKQFFCFCFVSIVWSCFIFSDFSVAECFAFFGQFQFIQSSSSLIEWMNGAKNQIFSRLDRYMIWSILIMCTKNNISLFYHY